MLDRLERDRGCTQGEGGDSLKEATGPQPSEGTAKATSAKPHDGCVWKPQPAQCTGHRWAEAGCSSAGRLSSVSRAAGSPARAEGQGITRGMENRRPLGNSGQPVNKHPPSPGTARRPEDGEEAGFLPQTRSGETHPETIPAIEENSNSGCGC